MKKDIEFIKEILNAFENSEKPYLMHTEIMRELDQANYDSQSWMNKYYHHIRLLYDTYCLQAASGHANRTGLEYFDDDMSYIDIDIRLTDNGHNMLIALNDDTIWKKLLNLGGKITAAALIKAGEKITEINVDQLFN